ncbi:acyltransferase [Limibacter armeniacum]|uniref:acyltransferase family protein n=1 Tax=Limibacter armeniacum TaxID=466084 RepID=UPI002FE58A66
MIPKLNKESFLQLEALRGLAALYVLINHSRGWLWVGGTYFVENNLKGELTMIGQLGMYLNMFTRLGHEFVVLFFLLSGFSIAYALHNSKDVISFLVRRGIRLYPPYLLSVLWALFVVYMTREVTPDLYKGVYEGVQYRGLSNVEYFLSFESIALLFVYVPTGIVVAQFWSLGYEVVFYLIAPFVVSKKSIYYVIISSLLYIVGTFFKVEYFLFNFVFVYNFYFAIGVFLFCYYIPIRKYLYQRVSVYVLMVFVLLLFIVMVGLNILWGGYSRLTELIALFLGGIMIELFLERGFKSILLSFIGKFSYSLYITHLATITLFISIVIYLFDLEPPFVSPFFYWLSLPFSLLVAYVQYLIIEKNTKRWLDLKRKYL